MSFSITFFKNMFSGMGEHEKETKTNTYSVELVEIKHIESGKLFMDYDFMGKVQIMYDELLDRVETDKDDNPIALENESGDRVISGTYRFPMLTGYSSLHQLCELHDLSVKIIGQIFCTKPSVRQVVGEDKHMMFNIF